MTFDDFVKDRRTVDAVIRNFAVIGEAAKHVPASVKKAHPEIKWKKMAGMRDKVIHEYFGVDAKILWETSKIDFPVSKPFLKKLLKNQEK